MIISETHQVAIEIPKHIYIIEDIRAGRSVLLLRADTLDDIYNFLKDTVSDLEDGMMERDGR